MTDSPSSPAPGAETDPANARGTARGDGREEARESAGRFALPLVIRVERAAPPARTDAMETAARAVLTFLADPRTAEETGAWHDRVRLWEERGIRKVVRRARGSEWRRVEHLESITLAERTAEVRVFPPVPIDGWPKDLSRLQVSGTDLTDPEPPPAPEPGTPVLWLSPDLGMTAGKAMAQAAHAAQLAWWELPERDRAAWRDAAFSLSVRPARDADHWAALTASGLPVVQDAGFTEIAPGSRTVVAEHPALRLREEPEPR